MAAKIEYDVRAVAPGEARADLLRIWRDNLNVPGGADRKYRWIYDDAPIAPERVFLLDARAGESDSAETVGTAGIGVRRFQVGDQLVAAALLVDLAVDKTHRSLGPALKLVRAVREHVLSTMGMAYGYPNKLALGVFKRARYRKLGPFARYARVLRHAPYLDRIAALPRVPRAFSRVIQLPGAPPVLGGMIDAGRIAYDAPRIAAALARYRTDSADEPDERADQIWQAARSDYGVVAERTARFLRWRFPGGGYRFHVMSSRGRGGEPLAYAITSRLDHEQVIWDMFGRVEHLGPLLDLVIPKLVPGGARTATLRFLGDPRVVDVLTSRGFREVEAERTVVYDAGSSLEGGRAALDDVTRWYLMDVDEDE